MSPVFGTQVLLSGDEAALTPLAHNAPLSRMLGCNVLLKCEHLLPTGSFKYRGATHKLRVLGDDAKRGVVTASSGNHGKAVAYAARAVGAPAHVIAADTIAGAKAEAIRALGATLELVGSGALDAERLARERAATTGETYISPYNDWDVVAGNGVIGREILLQAPEVDSIFVSVGGGGLLGGVGAAAKALKPSVRMIGCWPANAPSLFECLRDGALHHVDELPTVSDATVGGAEAGSITFELCRAVLDEPVLVDESEIVIAMDHVATHAGWIVEGAAGVALAGLIQRARELKGRNVAVVLCGGNVVRES